MKTVSHNELLEIKSELTNELIKASNLLFDIKLCERSISRAKESSDFYLSFAIDKLKATQVAFYEASNKASDLRDLIDSLTLEI